MNHPPTQSTSASADLISAALAPLITVVGTICLHSHRKFSLVLKDLAKKPWTAALGDGGWQRPVPGTQQGCSCSIKEFLEHNSTKIVEVSARQTETSSTEAAFSASPATIGALISLRQPKSQRIAGDCALFFAFSYPRATKRRVPKGIFTENPSESVKAILNSTKDGPFHLDIRHLKYILNI